MAQLSWGKPTIEFGKCVNGACTVRMDKTRLRPGGKFN